MDDGTQRKCSHIFVERGDKCVAATPWGAVATANGFANRKTSAPVAQLLTTPRLALCWRLVRISWGIALWKRLAWIVLLLPSLEALQARIHINNFMSHSVSRCISLQDVRVLPTAKTWNQRSLQEVHCRHPGVRAWSPRPKGGDDQWSLKSCLPL